ncbi:hypothetical protein C8R44DRAFT_889877 [Mycena epipterygia]|nr:hypothetical protein C8R44DRAFT_889877 [Mycena epipterygia]
MVEDHCDVPVVVTLCLSLILECDRANDTTARLDCYGANRTHLDHLPSPFIFELRDSKGPCSSHVPKPRTTSFRLLPNAQILLRTTATGYPFATQSPEPPLADRAQIIPYSFSAKSPLPAPTLDARTHVSALSVFPRT